MKFILTISVAGLFILPVLTTAQTSPADNKPSQSLIPYPTATDPSVYGVFEGRTPCVEIAGQLEITPEAGCTKLKWRLILYRDPATRRPTTYEVNIVGAGDLITQEGGSYRQKKLEGRWSISKGTKPYAEVYQLELGRPGAYFYLLKGDENVLFVLDGKKEFRVGNDEFSYTLNREELVNRLH